MSTDPYVYPGTQVLRNRREIRDADQFSRFEADATSFRILQLEHIEKPGALDIAHLQTIHRHIFQDVYDSAGDFRTVGIARQYQFAQSFQRGDYEELELVLRAALISPA